MEIFNISDKNSADEHNLSFEVQAKNSTHPVWIKSTHPLENPMNCGNAILCATLIPAMSANETLHIPIPINKKLIENTEVIQEIYHSWHPDFAHKENSFSMNNNETNINTNLNTNIGLFFSGGVDSFYTLLKNTLSITHLIYVHGFDVSLDDDYRRQEISSTLKAISEEMNLQLVEIETNLREFSDAFTLWGEHYFGAGLAMIAHLLAPEIGTIYISCDTTYRMLEPWGSHPLVTPLWGTSNSVHIFFGATATRFEKMRYLADKLTPAKYLHVCWEHKNNSINCGECEKCIRTMTALFLLQSLNYYSTLPDILTPDLIKSITLKNPLTVPFWEEFYVLANNNESSRHIALAISTIIEKYKFNTILEQISVTPNIINPLCENSIFRTHLINELPTKWLIKSTLKKIDGKYLFGYVTKMFSIMARKKPNT